MRSAATANFWDLFASSQSENPLVQCHSLPPRLEQIERHLHSVHAARAACLHVVW